MLATQASRRPTLDGDDCRNFSTGAKAGLEPARTHRLDAVKTLRRTGSPLAPEDFDYVSSRVEARRATLVISGGTDILGCFALGNPIGPCGAASCSAADSDESGSL